MMRDLQHLQDLYFKEWDVVVNLCLVSLSDAFRDPDNVSSLLLLQFQQ